MIAQSGEPPVQLPGEGVHREGVAGQRLLPPRVGHRAEQGDQRGRRGQHHVAGEGVLQQRRVTLEGDVEERVGGHEQHHEVGRVVERRPVRLGGQRVDMPPQVPGVRVEVGVPAALVAGLHGRQVRVERRLGVHHHRPAAVQPDHQVGADDLLVVGGGDLLGEVAVLQHARPPRRSGATGARPSGPAPVVPAAPPPAVWSRCAAHRRRRSSSAPARAARRTRRPGRAPARPPAARSGAGCRAAGRPRGPPPPGTARSPRSSGPAWTAPAGPRPPGWRPGWHPGGRCRPPTGTGPRASPPPRRRRGTRSPRAASRRPSPELARRIRRDTRGYVR